MYLACKHAVKRVAGGGRPKYDEQTDTEEQKIEMVVVVDTSGSMRMFSPKVILNSINQLVNNQRKTSPTTTMSILTFNKDINTIYDHMPISDIPDIVDTDIIPQHTTSLYDAFSRGLDILNKSTKSSKILLIITDGLENSSSTTRLQIIKKIKDSISKGILIKFLGGGQNAVAIGLNVFGIAEDCCLSFSNDNYGIDGAILSASKSLERHAQGKCHSFTPMERVTSISQEPVGLSRVYAHQSCGKGLTRTPTCI
jgi:uncharacterized protein YegL